MKRRKKGYPQERPPQHWEIVSILRVYPEHGEVPLGKIRERLKEIPGVQVQNSGFDPAGEILSVQLVYQDIRYQVELAWEPFEIEELYRVSSASRFRDGEMERICQVPKALTIGMHFGQDPQAAFHLQLKLALAAVPDLLGILDESAETIYPARWVQAKARSGLLPSVMDLFTIQQVPGENGYSWLHTHGLIRCGCTELEILRSAPDCLEIHGNLIRAMASLMLDREDPWNPRKDPYPVAQTSEGAVVFASAVSWVDALPVYPGLDRGSRSDRKKTHNTRTSVIFLWREVDGKEELEPCLVSDCDDLWGDNCSFLLGSGETERMRQEAIETFPYLQSAVRRDCEAVVEIGFPTDDRSVEYLWFCVVDMEGDSFRARLLQEPYAVSGLHTGQVRRFTRTDVAGWEYKTGDKFVKPESVWDLEPEER